MEMKMKETDLSSTCERAEELILVLYGEASETERRDFELHLKQCGSCRREFAAFGQVRESIGEWRAEALSGFVSAHAAAPVRKSALEAWRQFFDLSPLWLKGAVGFAAAVFCVLAALAVVRFTSTNAPVTLATGNPDAVYTQKDLERAIQEANLKQQRLNPVVALKPAIVVQSPTPRSSNVAKAAPKTRRPFSKAERDQLAAELRLITNDDEVDLDLLDDRRDR